MVVNNGEVGSSLDVLGDRSVTMVEPLVNLGYGRGVNRGAAASELETDYLLVTNPDVVVHDGAVAALVGLLDSSPDVGIVGPTIVTPTGDVYPSVRVFPNIALAAAHALIAPWWPTNPWTKKYRSPAPDGRVDWVSGACFLIRRDLFEQLGGFDERYFMFGEDMDLCWRARRAGARVAASAEAVVTHVEGVSRQHDPRAMLIAHHRGAIRFEWQTARGARRLLAPLAVGVLTLRLGAVLAATRWRSP